MLAGAADVLGFDQQRREQLALDAEMPLLGVRGLVRKPWPITRGLAAFNSAVVCGLTGTMGGNGLSIVRTRLKSSGLVWCWTFCEIVNGTFRWFRLPAAYGLGKYVMPKPVRSTVLMSSVSP